MPTDTTPQPTGEDAELALHLERLELAAKTLEAYTGDPRNNRARDVRAAATRLAALSAELEGARGLLHRLERAVSHWQAVRVINNGTATASESITDARLALDDAIIAARDASPNPAPAGRGEP